MIAFKEIPNLANQSKELQFFCYAFSPETYGESMGRAADQAAADFSKLSASEQQLALNWFLDLFAYFSENKFHLISDRHLAVIESAADTRFIPVLKKYCFSLRKWCKQNHNLSHHKSILTHCKKAIHFLKKAKFRNQHLSR